MSIAEDLYTAGYMTYPRTDNTVYPDDLEPDELLDEFVGDSTFGEHAEMLLEQADLTPTEGDDETTDHPPIHPTGEIPAPSELGEDEWEVFELVVRRFFATVAEPAKWAHLPRRRGSRGPLAEGQRQAPGRTGVPRGVPLLQCERELRPRRRGGRGAGDVGRRIGGQTDPAAPRRYGQSRLIQRMEDLGLGTKATRHNTIEKLYDRGYIENDPPRPTTLAKAVVKAAEEFADHVVSDDMTAQLEADMSAIANGEATLDDVTVESREMLEEVFEELASSREEVGEHLQESLKADKRLGPCPDCGDDLLVRRSRQGSYFVGCDGFPECENTLPLPSTGDPLVIEETCEEHEMNHVKMLAGRDTFVHGCPRCEVEKADETEDEVIGVCPDCGEEHDGELAIKRLRSGSRLVGCTRYPDCEYSLPLPRNGDIVVTEERCEEQRPPRNRDSRPGGRRGRRRCWRRGSGRSRRQG